MQSKTTFMRISVLLRHALMILFPFIIGNTIQAQTYVNGNLSTGAISNSGVTAPAGYTWSEVQNDVGVTTLSNTLSGIGTSIAGNLSAADDFTVPAGPNWDITKFTFYSYQTSSPATPSPFNALRLQIHNSDPSVGATTILFGDLTTNRLSASNDALMYRIFNSAVPAPGTTPGTTRKIWTLEANVTVSLPPGTYWVEWQTGTVSTANHFSPPSTVPGVRTVAGYNAQQHDLAGNTWAPIEDAGNPATPPNVALDMPFKIDYTVSCFGTPTPGNTLSTATNVCAGTPFTLSVQNATAGTGLIYQWQSGPAASGPWNNLPGATTATYTATQTADTWYQLVVTCAGSPGTSTPVQVTIIPAPTVTAPANATLCSGANTSFTVTGTGTGLTYQWQESTDGGTTFNNISDGGIYGGTTSNTLTLTGVPAGANNNQYQVVVTQPGCGTVSSTPATLTVNGAASFTTQPANVVVCAGSDATFNVTAVATTYQWQVSTDGGTTFTAIPAATSATLVVPAVTAGMDNYQYNVIITNPCTPGGLTSANAILTVSSVATITTDPANSTVCEGTDATFTATASGTSYQWQESTDGGANFTDIAGQTTTTLTLTAVTASMNGYQYRLVAFACGPTGLNSAAATLTVNTGVTISNPPSNVTACVGGDATFSITATGTATITYQWEASNDGGTTWIPIPGATSNTIVVPGVTSGMNNGLVHVILSNGCTATLTSPSAQLTVEDLPTIITQPLATSACEGSNASFSVSATGTGLSYQWQVSTDGGATFNNITDATNATLGLTAVTNSQNNNQYQVLVASSCSPAGMPSAAATLTVNALPVVTISASPYTSLTSSTTTTITATSTPASSAFSWFHDGTQVTGVTGPTLPVTHSDLGQYTAMVSDVNGCSNTSNAITITDSVVTTAFIYPNPTRGIFSVVFNDTIRFVSNTRLISAYDSKGSRVFTQKFVVAFQAQPMMVNMADLPRGVYVLELTDPAGVRLQTERVVLY